MRSSALDIRRIWRPPFQFSLLFTTATSVKTLHLYSHRESLPPLLTVLYFLTFISVDVINLIVFWVLVHLNGRSWTAVLLSIFKAVLSLILLGASSSWISFYIETGGEIKWGAAKNIANDAAGLKVLLSGSTRALLAAIFLVLIARLISHPLYNATERLLFDAVKTLTGYHLPRTSSREYKDPNSASALENGTTYHRVSTEDGDISDYTSSDGDESPLFAQPETTKTSWVRQWINRLKYLVPIGTTLVLFIVRPKGFPWGHMSNSMPYTLLDIWTNPTEEMCLGNLSGDFPPFPLPDLISEVYWEPAKGEFPGWQPTVNRSFESNLERPSWLPEEPMHGFERWYNDSAIEDSHGDRSHKHGKEGSRRPPEGMFSKGINYDPVTDPLRITNLDQELLESIKDTIKNRKIAIKHVVIVSMETTRKDIFPFKRGSHLHDIVIKSHKSNENISNSFSQLTKLTQNTELLTGETSGFGTGDLRDSSARLGSWRNLKKGTGGLNVQGAFTTSTSTFKSFIGSHCGTHPLPVDFTVEASRENYQPCIPSILELFNHNKPGYKKQQSGTKSEESKRNATEDRPWRSVFVQAITDQFDRQDELNERVGFSETIVKSTLVDPASAHYPPTEKESNYFGFPETQVKPYIRDLFKQAEEKNERLFLSHFTSSTHHPWATPEAFGDTIDYLGRSRWSPESALNKYLNTVNYVDNWIGQIMDMIEELGVADETLVVMVGDHGWAFEEDAPFHGTFENGHIANVRVPLLFHHPSLPREQLHINATSVSIIPTILDLLTATSSLNKQDTVIAKNLIHQYEGQSLIRPFQSSKNGRQAWNIGVINAGGAILSVSSAAVPYRLAFPICRNGVYRFTDNVLDPNEIQPIEQYSLSALEKEVRKVYGEELGDEVAEWVQSAGKVGKWWVLEQRRRWRYGGAALQDDRRSDEMDGMGKIKKAHWWNT